MSRIGKQPITIPDKVEIKLEAETIIIKGPKGQLSQFQLPGITCVIKEQECLVQRSDETKSSRSKHGLMRSLLSNMIVGVTEGFEKQLEVVGIGYKVRLEGKQLVFNIGFSHEVKYNVAEDIEVSVDANKIKIKGIDKQKVGQIAAAIRDLKKPEPYKGKGIRYQNEVVRRKAGKGAKEA